jgi:putative SOS response-associated peptidase YedK
MCGRFEIHSPIEIIAKLFAIDSITFDIRPSYNVAPSQNVVAVARNGKKNRLLSCRWGFVPSWSKELKTGFTMINARAETVADNKTYKSAFQDHRCLIVADGFFEWKKQNRMKIPMYIHLKSGKPMGLAGLYNNWTSPEGEEICTSTVIVTDANEILAPIHERMPVIIPEEKFGLWLDPEVHDKELLLPLLKPYDSEELEMYPVTAKVNSAKYDNPENIMPVAV